MKFWYSLSFIILLQLLCLVTGNSYCGADPLTPGSVTIVIEPVFNGQPLQLGNQYYVNQHGDTVYIDLFRFYITNLKIVTGERVVADTNNHLVDAEADSTLKFSVRHVPSGQCSSLQFMIGVDSIANTSGANGGDLDPSKGMYWAWNTGYIMAKLEGHSAVCKTLHHAFEFHIGGYMPPYNAVREVKVKLADPVAIMNGCTTIIKIKADVAAWFGGNLDLSKLNDVVIPGKEANIIADNYSKMFSADQ